MSCISCLACLFFLFDMALIEGSKLLMKRRLSSSALSSLEALVGEHSDFSSSFSVRISSLFDISSDFAYLPLLDD